MGKPTRFFSLPVEVRKRPNWSYGIFTTGKILIKNQIISSFDRLFTTTLFDYLFRVNRFTNVQLFRQRLSEKVHATISKGIVGGFEFTVLQRSLKE